MSENASYALIRGGEPRFYEDNWSGEVLHRNLVWGPEALEEWVETLEEVDAFDEECESAVVVDFDRKQLTYRIDSDSISIPLVGTLFHRLVSAAWKGYEVNWAALDDELLAAVERNGRVPAENGLACIEYRHQSVAQAAGLAPSEEDEQDASEEYETSHYLNSNDDGDENWSSEDDEDESDDDDDSAEFDDDETRAWITIIQNDGSVEHRQLGELPQELLQAKKTAIDELSELPACDMPAEVLVHEGMWIDVKTRNLSLWGGPGTQAAMPVVESSWKGWTVQWAPRGYTQHCAAAGPLGKALTANQALGLIVPTLLSTHRPDLHAYMRSFRRIFRRWAFFVAAVLMAILCLPVVIFGLVSGLWKAAGITIAIVCGLVLALCLLIENRISRALNMGVEALQPPTDSAGPPAAGPLDNGERWDKLNELFKSAGLPPLDKVMAHSRL